MLTCGFCEVDETIFFYELVEPALSPLEVNSTGSCRISGIIYARLVKRRFRAECIL